MQCLVEVYGGNRRAADLARVLRVAGTWTASVTRSIWCASPRHPEIVMRAKLLSPPFQRRQMPSKSPPAGPPPILTDAMAKRHRAYCTKGLRADVKSLACLREPGRNGALFKAAARWGKYVHHAIISTDELQIPLLDACNANGLIKNDGRRNCVATIQTGMEKARGDMLEDLPQREDLRGERAGTARTEQSENASREKVLRRFNRNAGEEKAVNIAWPELTESATPRQIATEHRCVSGGDRSHAQAQRIFRCTPSSCVAGWRNPSTTTHSENCTLRPIAMGCGQARSISTMSSWIARARTAFTPCAIISDVSTWDGQERLNWQERMPEQMTPRSPAPWGGSTWSAVRRVPAGLPARCLPSAGRAARCWKSSLIRALPALRVVHRCRHGRRAVKE